MSMLNIEDPPAPPDQPEPGPVSIDKSPKKKSRFKTIRGWTTTLILLALLAALIASIFAMFTPSWYQPPPDPNADEVTSQAATAQALLLDLRNKMTNPKITQPIQWSITQPQVDSLLATIAGDGKDETKFILGQHHGLIISSPFIHFTDDAVTFALRVENLPGDGVVSLTLGVHTIPSSNPNTPAMVQIQIQSLQVGMLPLPSSVLFALLKSHILQSTGPVERAVTWFVGSKTAGNIGPQIVNDIQDVLNGKPFPMQLRMGSRTLTVERLEFRDSSTDSSGQLQPASLTIEFTPSS